MTHITDGAIETEGNTPEARAEFAEYVANRAARDAYDAIKARHEAERELREWQAEYNELKRLLIAALTENPGWYTDAAQDAERLLGVREGDDA